jgi:hydrogenase maturation protease
MSERAVVVGIGNPWRSDDAVGWLVAERIAELVGDGTRVVLLDGEPGRVLDAWDGARLAVVIDGMRTGRPVGTVIVFSAEELPPTETSGSTHGLGLAHAMRLGEAVGRLPKELVAVGVEIGNIALGQQVTPKVANAIDTAAAHAVEALSR